MAMAYRPQVKDGRSLFRSKEINKRVGKLLVSQRKFINREVRVAKDLFLERTCWIYAVICFMFAQSQRTDSKTEHLYRQRYSSFCAANNRAKHYTGKWILKSTTS
ncbi:hypothetical protein NC651_014715 [Populus alba x Populus x berolinensis]|nr:hypothetical protein NC651_014715 [Populus alba x Populus x berolinensis]